MKIGKKLTNLTMFSRVFEQMKSQKDLPFLKGTGIFEKESNLFDNIDKFMKNYYLNWLNEMEKNERSFAAFDFTNGTAFHSLVKGYPVEKKRLEGWLFPSYDDSQVFLEMSRDLREKKRVTKEKSISSSQLINASYNAIEKVNKRINFS